MKTTTEHSVQFKAYTLTNPDLPPVMTRIAGLTISSTALSVVITTRLIATATNYVLRCHDLLFPLWSTIHTFSGVSGRINWSDPASNGWGNVFSLTESA